MMAEVVATGDGVLLEERILAIHRLKTAIPAASLARMGAVGGGASEAQIEGLGCFFESVGLAFQIIDDVLNLRGFKGDLKSRGEDIMHGKVTLPVAKAMAKTTARRSSPSDPAAVAALARPWTLPSPPPHKPPVGEHAGGSLELGGA
jgi:geranylgeranyl pyrophosphate synthase